MTGSGRRPSLRLQKLRGGQREGVASVIGTIFALMIFMTLLTLLVTSFVPAWEKSNEQGFLDTVVFQMGLVKSANLNLMNSETGGSTQYVPFVMAPSKVPLFGKNYLGNLEHSSNETVSSMTLSFQDSSGRLSTVTTAGSLTYKLLNSYSDQVVVYEHGGVILSNIDGSERNSVFKSAPTITYTRNANSTLNLFITQFDFVGPGASKSAFGTVGLVMTISETTTLQHYYSIYNGAMTLTWSTLEAGAWKQWAGAYFNTGTTSQAGNVVTLSLTDVYSLHYTIVKTEIGLE